MTIKSTKIGENVYFNNFAVIKESDTFYAVYEKWTNYDNTYNRNYIITHGSTLQSACKKAKLLQLGYDLAKDNR